jgi:2-succinyl-5-enolpyruvyl-6-hydroxy-3-cyclohexene-1-carboxylate synthase
MAHPSTRKQKWHIPQSSNTLWQCGVGTRWGGVALNFPVKYSLVRIYSASKIKHCRRTITQWKCETMPWQDMTALKQHSGTPRRSSISPMPRSRRLVGRKRVHRTMPRMSWTQHRLQTPTLDGAEDERTPLQPITQTRMLPRVRSCGTRNSQNSREGI